MSLIGIKLVRGGRLIVSWWNNETKEIEEIDQSADLYKFITERIDLAEDLTLRDFISLISVQNNIGELGDLLTGSPDCLFRLLGEALKYTTEVSGFDYLELSWRASIDSDGDFHKWVSFNGVGKPEENMGYSSEELIPYGLDFMPINKLINLPVKLENKFKIYDEIGMLDNVSVLIETTGVFTLYDVLCGIFGELSFHGDPETRDKEFEKLNNIVEEIENGTADLISWDEVKERLNGNKEKAER